MNIEILLYLKPRMFYFLTFTECDMPKAVAWHYMDIAFDLNYILFV
jgi:hypothetical protein